MMLMMRLLSTPEVRKHLLPTAQVGRACWSLKDNWEKFHRHYGPYLTRLGLSPIWGRSGELRKALHLKQVLRAHWIPWAEQGCWEKPPGLALSTRRGHGQLGEGGRVETGRRQRQTGPAKVEGGKEELIKSPQVLISQVLLKRRFWFLHQLMWSL